MLDKRWGKQFDCSEPFSIIMLWIVSGHLGVLGMPGTALRHAQIGLRLRSGSSGNFRMRTRS